MRVGGANGVGVAVPTSYFDPELGMASPAWQVTKSPLEYW
jgi:hypothetical protein